MLYGVFRGSAPLSEPEPIRLVHTAMLVVISSLALLWPAILNGGPFWFPDSSTYIRGADAAIVTVTGQPSEWSDLLVELPPPSGTHTDSEGAQTSKEAQAKTRWEPARPVITGRSVYYGMTLYLPMRLFGPWGGIVFQALVVAGLIVGALVIVARETALDARVVVPAIIAALIALTPLPFYSSMLMPDVYSGVLILLLATVMVFWSTLRIRTRVGLLCACAVIATFHGSHVPIAAAVAGAAFLLSIRDRSRFRPLLLVLPVIATAFVAGAAFTQAVKWQLGREPISPPFLSARITSSGPGKAYLDQHCTGSREDFALCAYKDRLPLPSDDFLWSERPEGGVFQVADSRQQRQIAEEDEAFFLAVLADDPLPVLAVSGQAFVRLLTAFDLENFNYSSMLKETAPQKLPPAAESQFRDSRAFAGDMPVELTVGATIASTLVAFILLLFAGMGILQRQNGPLSGVMKFALLIVLGVLANALVCGAVSKPGARYQMRLIWLIPVAAMMTTLVGRPNDARNPGPGRGPRLSKQGGAPA
jgi:hypothetical protein